MEKNYAETRKNSALLHAFLAQQKEKEAEGLFMANEFPEIPVTTLAELEGLNNSLSKDKELFRKMVNMQVFKGTDKDSQGYC